MELLFAYALLMFVGYDVWEKYSEELDRLFLDDPDNDLYLHLESTTDIIHTVKYIDSNMNRESFDVEKFGKALMKIISDIYKTSDLNDFSERMHSLWNNLPFDIRENDPFHIFCYADDFLSICDEAQCRESYEKAMNFYT